MWVGILLAPLVVACVSNPPGADSAVQGPVSQQTAVGDARLRAKAHAELGSVYLREGRLNVALDEARVAVEADPSYPLGHNLLGLVHLYLKENRAAEESFARAMRLAPNDPEINNNYGWFLCATGREQEAIPHFETAARSPLYAVPTKPLTNAALCLLGIKDDTRAEDFLLRALRADGGNTDAQFLLADLYYRTGRVSDAQARLDALHKGGDPTAQSAWLGLRIERKLGDREAENRFATQIRRNFKGSREYDLMIQGKFE